MDGVKGGGMGRLGNCVWHVGFYTDEKPLFVEEMWW